MQNLIETALTDLVISRIKAENSRNQEVLTKLVKHLHAFVKDVEPTEEEWFKAINFLTQTGQKCDDKRQEFILFSDVLGVSMLVDAINHRSKSTITETTVKGPFHAAAQAFEAGENIARGIEAERGETTVVHGRVLAPEGNPVANATLDVWQSDDIGYYDVQDVNQPQMNLRGIFKTNANGEFWFRTIKPAAYPVPTDGPVGDLLRASGRHAMRPAHIHFWIKAEGYQDIITHLFVEGDEYLESDAVFGVKDSLVIPFVKNTDTDLAAKWKVTAPFFEAHYDFTLAKK
ncbi:6-chlorohydroxyquinol-1,2-dioxygenase [Chryseotalea sanaruensis]|uniref:6-chlorohydroxyquinol-1,2-dioxygenase n=1 Tax=Chryseotalea sanaruensis TaxID=2482724 RepID=A0A401U6K2_9BACT|nr:dioxygenase [Chryseotalea sanaruensis]GCC50499.1 6-chlorohydroxyquinol-1,2-dioxygenase [Chryseotalea sanaruensis]